MVPPHKDKLDAVIIIAHHRPAPFGIPSIGDNGRRRILFDDDRHPVAAARPAWQSGGMTNQTPLTTIPPRRHSVSDGGWR